MILKIIFLQFMFYCCFVSGNRLPCPSGQAGTTLSLTVTLSGNPIFTGHNLRMTESCINVVISTSVRGELKISGAKSLRTNRPLLSPR